jgi:BirA family biotin operon repressor/biotin-[acetyl-CoA-carboxylase] ligase
VSTVEAGTPAASLDEHAIRGAMSPAGLKELSALEILPVTDSTNSEMQLRPTPDRHGRAILADRQTAGRGRRGREWHSPAAGNIYLSLGWWFDNPHSMLGFLPLAVAVQTCRALSRMGLRGYGIKWPNDILVNDRKLAGILVESFSDARGGVNAVIGVGVNVRMPLVGTGAGPGAGPRDGSGGVLGVIDQPWTDLVSELENGGDASRNELAGLLIDELLTGARVFASDGFTPFLTEWRQWDLLHGKRITVNQPGLSADNQPVRVRHGLARGIGPEGGLMFEDEAGGKEQLLAAQVSVRHD